MVKSLEFFFQSYNKCFISEFLALWSNLIQSRRVFAVHREKSFVPAFLRSVLITYLITLSLEKEIIVLEKSLRNL